MKNQPIFPRLSLHVEQPSENSFLPIIEKLVENNSQLIGLLDAERLTNAELTMENATLKIELGNEKAANLRYHEARSCELPSVVQFMQRINEKNPQEAEDKHVSNTTITKQEIERRLSMQMKEIQAPKHK